MNPNLVLTWTPILKELPDEERERARELIEKYGETNPTNFIVELLEIFGIHANYLQSIPTQIRIAGERAKADANQAVDAVTTLHERTRLELGEMISVISRTGAVFTKALETTTATQVRASEKATTEIQDKIQIEFARQNLPAITSSLRDIQEKADKSLKIAQRIHEQAEQYEEFAKDRLATSEKLCTESLSKVESLNWRGAWVVSFLCSTALMIIVGCCLYGRLRWRYEGIMADKIALASATIQQNRDAFAELAVAGVSLKVHRTTDRETGEQVAQEFAILIENAEAAEMRTNGSGKAGFIFVKVPTTEEEMHHLEIRVENLMNEFQTRKFGNQRAK